jgi:polysaccharide deacetylase 2 family uncharacterized protein YibQ
MAPSTRRRFKRPVFSRLTLAWTAFGAACAGVIGYAYFAFDADKPRVALAVQGEAERFARAGPAESARSPAPSFPAAEKSPADAPDALIDDSVPAEDALALGEPPVTDDVLEVEPEEVIITIDGAPAGAKKPVGARAASYVNVAVADPDPLLLQKTALGAIPKVGEDGRRASLYYARPEADARGPRVGLVVGGLGLNADLTARAIDELPPEVTLAFAPYAKNLDFWAKRARKAGHEIVIELPMESQGGSPDALGPAALLSDRAPQDNLRRLDWLLSRLSGYFAATNYLGAKFSSDPDALAPVLQRLDALGVAYIDDTGAAAALGENRAVGEVDRIILAGDPREAEGGLKALGAAAGRSGAALGKTYVSEAAIDAVKAWASELEEIDVTLAPASAILRLKAGQG